VRCLVHVKGTLCYLDVRRCSDVTFDGVYFVGKEMTGLETLKIGPVFGINAQEGVDEVWKVLQAGTGRPTNLEVFGMQDGGTSDAMAGAEISGGGLQSTVFESALRMVSFMDTNIRWDRLRGLGHVEYLNVSRSLPVSFTSTSGGQFPRNHLPNTPERLDFPRLKTFKASNSSLPWPVVQAVLEGAPGLVDLHLGGWEGLKPSRLVSSVTHGEMVAAFSKALCGLQQLETLHLSKMHLENEHVREFLEGNRRFLSWDWTGRLRVLDLSSNPKLGLGDRDGDDCRDGLCLSRWSPWALDELKVLNISNTGIQIAPRQGRTQTQQYLRELMVSGRNFVQAPTSAVESIQSFVEFVHRAPNLKLLHMTDITALEDVDLIKILDRPSRCGLEDLSIAGCSALTPEGLRPLKNLVNLNKLDVSRLGKAVTDENLAAILCRNMLTELRASGADLTSASLDALLQSKMLHYADVSFCFGMGDDELCGSIVSRSGSPIKIRLPRGSARLGLFNDAADRNVEEGRDITREEEGTVLGNRASRRLAFE
jgi:hypothetical protein